MISVAMASYNGEKYIKDQMDSILESISFQDEVLVSDDGSTDATREIIKQYVKRDSRVHLYDGPEKGIIANFQYVISLCQGTHIFLADQDDVWAPEKITKVMELFQKTGCGLVMHDAAVYNEDLSEQIMPSFFRYRGSKAGVLNNIIKNRYMGCCMAFKSELREYCLPIPTEIQMHDQWIGLINDIRKEGTVLLEEPLLKYRRHQGASSDFEHNTWSVMIKNRMVLLRELQGCKARILGK